MKQQNFKQLERAEVKCRVAEIITWGGLKSKEIVSKVALVEEEAAEEEVAVAAVDEAVGHHAEVGLIRKHWETTPFDTNVLIVQKMQ